MRNQRRQDFTRVRENVKTGCYEDDSNRSKLSKFLRFVPTKSVDKGISLNKCLVRMQESQESIYYMSGGSMEVTKKTPFHCKSSR